MYLDALFDKDPHLAFDYSDLQVDLYAEYDPNKLMDFLRASSYYSLERVSTLSSSAVSVADDGIGVWHLRYARLGPRDGLLARQDGRQ